MSVFAKSIFKKSVLFNFFKNPENQAAQHTVNPAAQKFKLRRAKGLVKEKKKKTGIGVKAHGVISGTNNFETHKLTTHSEPMFKMYVQGRK